MAVGGSEGNASTSDFLYDELRGMSRQDRIERLTRGMLQSDHEISRSDFVTAFKKALLNLDVSPREVDEIVAAAQTEYESQKPRGLRRLFKR